VFVLEAFTSPVMRISVLVLRGFTPLGNYNSDSDYRDDKLTQRLTLRF
jgi:hypothetical protein